MTVQDILLKGLSSEDGWKRFLFIFFAEASGRCRDGVRKNRKRCRCRQIRKTIGAKFLKRAEHSRRKNNRIETMGRCAGRR